MPNRKLRSRRITDGIPIMAPLINVSFSWLKTKKAHVRNTLTCQLKMGFATAQPQNPGGKRRIRRLMNCLRNKPQRIHMWLIIILRNNMDFIVIRRSFSLFGLFRFLGKCMFRHFCVLSSKNGPPSEASNAEEM